jgi:hypothetical protein
MRGRNEEALPAPVSACFVADLSTSLCESPAAAYPAAMANLTTSLERPRQFRATFYEDEESGFTADVLSSVVWAVEAFGEDVVAGDLDETD